jgi:hypothetical protein
MQMTTLSEIRKDWERGWLVVFEYAVTDDTLVSVVAREGDYRILRFFTIGGEWVCSVDYDRGTANETLERLSDVLNHVKK